jgi:hypothetical protein
MPDLRPVVLLPGDRACADETDMECVDCLKSAEYILESAKE